MAFELTIDGYTFDNPPSNYRKRIDLGNSPQPHYEKNATPFYRSDSQQITLQLDGRLNLNDQGDLDELEKIQEKAIQGGEVDVQFDPFFSGRGVIEDEPIEQENQRGRYSFSIAINEETTDTSAYPAHATPTTGNTFELGDFDFGFDPESVSQEYERQTERVDRLGGVAHTADTKGLVTRVSLDGRVDGGGQAELWSKARSNALAYLTAEFQNGWALLNSLSVSKDDATPDYLQGLFTYSAEFLIVKDPTSGIGETSQFINHDVGDSGTYTSDDDAGTGSDEGGLDFKVLGGTGSIDGRYVDWVTTTITLDDNTTNYVFVDDSDADGQGQVVYNTTAFPQSDALPLYEVDTSNGEIVDVRDVRDSLLNEDDDTTSDLLFRDEFAIDDTAFSYAQILALAAEGIVDPQVAKSYLGLADFSESIADPAEAPLDALGLGTLATETLVFDDNGGGSTTTLTWGTSTDWNNAVAATLVDHDSDPSIIKARGWDSFEDTDFSEYTNHQNTQLDRSSQLTPQDGSYHAIFEGQSGWPLNFERTSWSYSGQRVRLEMWVAPDINSNSGNDMRGGIAFGIQDSNNFYFSSVRETSSTDHEIEIVSGGGFSDTVISLTDSNLGDGTIRKHIVEHDPSTGDIYFEVQDTSGNTIDSASTSDGTFSGGTVGFTAYRGVDHYVDGLIAQLGDSSLTTGTKSFGAAFGPSDLSLDNVAATLNNETIQVYVESDPDGDGNFEETSDPVALDGSGGPYSISGLSSSSATFRLRFDFSYSDPTQVPELDAIDLVGGGGGDEFDQNRRTTWEIQGAKFDTSGNEYEGGGVVSRYAG